MEKIQSFFDDDLYISPIIDNLEASYLEFKKTPNFEIKNKIIVSEAQIYNYTSVLVEHEKMLNLGLYHIKNKLELYEKINPEKASDIAVIYADYMIHNNLIDELDQLLSSLDTNELGEWSIVAILTSTFEARHYLSQWNFFYQNSFYKLKKDRLPVEEILFGFDR